LIYRPGPTVRQLTCPKSMLLSKLGALYGNKIVQKMFCRQSPVQKGILARMPTTTDQARDR